MQISVLIPTLNSEAIVERTLRSAVEQLDCCGSETDSEIIVFDAGSTDATCDIVRNFHPGIQLYTDAALSRLSDARNQLATLAKGTWLQYLRPGDVLSENSIRDKYKIGQKKFSDLVYSVHDETNGPRPRQIASSRDTWVDFIRMNGFVANTVLFRREQVLRAGGWHELPADIQASALILRMLLNVCRIEPCDHIASPSDEVIGPCVGPSEVPDVINSRLDLIEVISRHLQASETLTPPRISALDTIRLELARAIYPHDKVSADRVFRKAGRLGLISASQSQSLPLSYRVKVMLLGFLIAERLSKAETSDN